MLRQVTSGTLRPAYVTMVFVDDDVIKWKHFPRYWLFVRGIHRWPVNSPHKGQWRGFDSRLIKRFSKQSRHRWFETPSRPLWRYCNGWPGQDDVITWKRFLAFIYGENPQLRPIESPHKVPVFGSNVAFFAVRLNKRLVKQLSYWWFETSWRPWDGTGMPKPLCLPSLYRGMGEVWTLGKHGNLGHLLFFVNSYWCWSICWLMLSLLSVLWCTVQYRYELIWRIMVAKSYPQRPNLPHNTVINFEIAVCGSNLKFVRIALFLRLSYNLL